MTEAEARNWSCDVQLEAQQTHISHHK